MVSLYFDFHIIWCVTPDTVTAENKLKKDNNMRGGSKGWWDYMAVLLVDFVLIVLPILLCLTVSLLN